MRALLTFLSDNEIEQIHEASLRILMETGVKILSEKVRKLLAENGAEVDGDIVKIPKPMVEEAATAGFYEPVHFPGNYYPRIQILTIQELLHGKKVDYPQHAPVATFKRAQRHRKNMGAQQRLV